MTVTKDSVIGEIIAADTAAAECFFRVGMFCIGCPASAGETLEEACAAHGVDCQLLVDSLNDFFGTEA